ncbi:MAG: hypothetical protein ABFS23_05125 [Pseudomonadota bacterium]
MGTTTPNQVFEEKPSFARKCVRVFGRYCIYASTLAIILVGALTLLWLGMWLFA